MANVEKRIIHWQSGNTQYARAFIFGNYGWSVADYMELVKIAKADFPELTDADIQVGSVRESSYMKGFKLICWPVEGGTSHEGYADWDRFDFYWL